MWAYLCSQVNQNLEKIRQQERETLTRSYAIIAPVYAIAIDSNYFQDILAFIALVCAEDTTGEVLTITINGQETIWSRYVLGIKIQRNQQRQGS